MPTYDPKHSINTARFVDWIRKGATDVRRRERWLNLAWLHGLNQSRQTVLSWPADTSPMSISASVHTLVHDYGRYLEMEQEGDVYKVRSLPAAYAVGIAGTRYGAAYSGTDLARVLTAAVCEMDIISDADSHPELGATEMWRWVP